MVKAECDLFAKITTTDTEVTSETKDRDGVVEGPVSRQIQHCNMCAEGIVNPPASLLVEGSTE